MRIADLFKDPEIVSRKQTACNRNQASSHNGCDLCRQTPNPLLGSVDINDRRQKPSDRVERSGPILMVSRASSPIRRYSQKHFIHNPNIILPPPEPQKETSSATNTTKSNTQP